MTLSLPGSTETIVAPVVIPVPYTLIPGTNLSVFTKLSITPVLGEATLLLVAIVRSVPTPNLVLEPATSPIS